jgi:uncharacterized protein DUF4012
VAAVVAVVLAWAGWCAVLLLAARHDLYVGKAEAEVARRQTSTAALESGAAVTPLRSAASRFAAGRRELRSPALWPVRFLPVVGRQLHSAQALSSAGAQGSRAAADALDQARADLRTVPRDGPGRIQLLRDLATIGTSTDRQLAALDLGPRQKLIPVLAKSRNTLADELAKSRDLIRRGEAAVSGALSLLSGQHRILLIVGNNAEMRAGAGMPLQVGTLAASDGRLTLESIESTNDITLSNLPSPSGALQSIWGNFHPTHDFGELFVDPAFNDVAPVAARMWENSGNPSVDGVMFIDPVFLQQVLSATGPVTVGSRSFDASGILRELLHDQYVRYPDFTARREELGALAHAVFSRVDAGGYSLSKLADGMATATRGRDLMLWSAAAEDQWRTISVAGALGDDSVLVSIINRGVNKLDYFLDTRATLTVDRGPTTTNVTIRLRLVNHAPTDSGEPSYVVGPAPGFVAGDYHGIVQVNLPGLATDAGFVGVPQLELFGSAPPTQVIAVPFTIRAGGETEFVAHFHLAASARMLRVEPMGRAPATAWSDGATTWTSDGSHAVTF